VEALETRALLTTVTVNTLLDASAASASTSPVDTNGNGEISLRSAIEYLNATGGGSVAFDSALYAGGPATILLSLGELSITKAESIQGPGADNLTIDAQHQSRVFHVFEIVSVVALFDSISGLTMTNGLAGASNNDGGAIYNSGNLTLTDDAITDSASILNGKGGGIFNYDGGRLSMMRDTVTGNSAPGGGGGVANSAHGMLSSTSDTISGNTGVFLGGGIYNAGTLNSTLDTISGNTATPNPNGGCSGGGIGNDSSASLTTSQDTITGNQAVGRSQNVEGGPVSGGGVYIAYQGTYTSSGDTISGNLAQGGAALGPNGAFGGNAAGGGLYVVSQAVVSLTDDTVSGNQAIAGDATNTAGGSAAAGNGTGGGIDNFGGSLTLTAATISGNSAVGGTGTTTNGQEAGGGLSSGGSGTTNLIDSVVVGNRAASGANIDGSLSAASRANVIDTSLAQVLSTDSAGNPLLADNGGPTQTIALVPGSATNPNPALGAAVALATLGSGLIATDTADTITVDSTTFLALGDALKIGSEIVTIQQFDATPNTLNVVRAQHGTIEASHNAGDPISLAYDQRGVLRDAAADIGAFESQLLRPTVTVADAGGVYTGSAYPVTAASVVGQGGAVLASLGDPSLSYSYYQGTLTAAAIASATPLPGAPIDAGDYTVVAHFTSNIGGYTDADSSPTPFSITPAAVTYTIANDSQTYGSPANPAGDLGTTISTGVNGETLDIAYASMGDTATANVGSYAITGTLSVGSGSLANYTVTLNDGTLTVNPYAFTYTIGNDSQTYGRPANLAGDLGTAISMGVNGETLDISYASTGDTATANVGGYAIAGTLSDGSGSLSNYTVTLNDGTLTVNPYAFTYTIGNDSQTYGSPANLASDLGTTISTGVNGETLNIAYTSTGDTATALPGQYAITGTLSDDTGLLSNYSATLNPGTLTVAGGGATVIGDTLWLIGGNGNDLLDVTPVGPRHDGSSGIRLDARLDGLRIAHVYSQSFDAIHIVGFGGNDQIEFARSLAIPAVVSEGNGNDWVQLGNGDNTVTVGGGTDDITVGDGNNVIVAVGGNDWIRGGAGDNLIVGGGGHDNIGVGGGNNILIDGSVSQSTDQLWAVLDQWMTDIQHGDAAGLIASDLQNGLTIQYNASSANQLNAGRGFDAFFATYAKDHLNAKPGDLVNGAVVSSPAGRGHTDHQG
jgi:hypothetical protein